jgi:sodium pump decarboxylase gamma subunit
MALGMGMVFVFLVVLVLALLAMSRTAHWLDARRGALVEEEPPASPPEVTRDPSPEAELIAVIGAAIARFRGTRR